MPEALQVNPYEAAGFSEAGSVPADQPKTDVNSYEAAGFKEAGSGPATGQTEPQRKPFGLMDTWPVKLATGLYESVKSGVTLPGDVYAGRASPEDTGRVLDLATLATPKTPSLRNLAPSLAETAATSAENIGVNLPKAIATNSPSTQFIAQVSKAMPGGSPLREAIGKSIEQTGQALETATSKAGGTPDLAAAGEGFAKAVEGKFLPAVKSKISEAYDNVGKLVDKNATSTLDNTQGAVADIVARRMASGREDQGKAVASVLGGITRPGGLTFNGIKDLRTSIGEMLDTGIFPEGMSQGELRRIYGALSDDLKASASASGGERALAAFERANKLNDVVEGWKDNLSKLLGADRSGESVSGAIIRAASEGSSGDIKTLALARAAVPPDVWRDVASTAVSQLGKNRKGEFSPAIFLNDYAAMSDKGKKLLFGSVGSGDLLPFLDDIAKVSGKFIEAGKLANFSQTAGHATAAQTAYGVLGGVGAYAAGTGSIVEPLSAVGLVVGNNVLARVLSSKATAASMARWSRAYDSAVYNPSAATAVTLNITSRNLANTINSAFGTSFSPRDFIRNIEGPVKAASQPNQPEVPRVEQQ